MKKEMEGRAEIGEEEREIGDKEISEMSNLFVSRLRKQQRSEKEARKEEVRCCLRQKEKEGFFHCTFSPFSIWERKLNQNSAWRHLGAEEKKKCPSSIHSKSPFSAAAAPSFHYREQKQ
jgi:hypothetical protein